MSAPVFELLKRPDELFVVEHAHLHPRFVEDSVRLMIAGSLERYPNLSDGCFLLARQVNHETIHNHDVLAERHGVVSELRADLDGSPGGAANEHTTARVWLEG
jgi:GTP cyclohydrolase IV